MAHFAELDSNNTVLRVVVACNQDIANNGGEQSEQAAKHFETVCPFSEGGVKWVQTSYNHNFRKQFAIIGSKFDFTKDKFILTQPFPSWSLDVNDDWKAPVQHPPIITEGENKTYLPIYWDENGQRWYAKDNQKNEVAWIPESSSWVATGN
jgi:hypothetical protein